MLKSLLNRRAALGAALALSLWGCAAPPAAVAPPAAAPTPIVFVHGNGDSSALWITTLWRFESNGWPRERLFAIDLGLPSARDDDNKPQVGRSSTTEHAQFIAAAVDAALARTGAKQVALVGNSRGANGIRNYVKNFGGAAKVSHVVLGGGVNHGVYADAALNPGSEFNGAGPFMQALNAPQGAAGEEVTSGPRWMTIRSDNNDKFAQPDGVWLGRRGTPTNVSFDAPALKGAENVVLPRRDHREVSYHAEAFVHTYRFIAGKPAATMAIAVEPKPVLDGRVSGIGPGGTNNLPLANARVEVHQVDPATGSRIGAARWEKNVGDDGRWGPFTADASAHYEFVISAPGYATLHIYRSPFPRSSSHVHWRAERLSEADKAAASVVRFTRPRAYFGVPRDRIVMDGVTPPPGVPTGVAGVAVTQVRLNDTGRAVAAEFESESVRERLVGRAWPTAENRLVVLEMHY
jgi:triacylglycerol lipase